MICLCSILQELVNSWSKVSYVDLSGDIETINHLIFGQQISICYTLITMSSYGLIVDPWYTLYIYIGVHIYIHIVFIDIHYIYIHYLYIYTLYIYTLYIHYIYTIYIYTIYILYIYTYIYIYIWMDDVAIISLFFPILETAKKGPHWTTARTCFLPMLRPVTSRCGSIFCSREKNGTSLLFGFELVKTDLT